MRDIDGVYYDYHCQSIEEFEKSFPDSNVVYQDVDSEGCTIIVILYIDNGVFENKVIKVG